MEEIGIKVKNIVSKDSRWEYWDMDFAVSKI